MLEGVEIALELAKRSCLGGCDGEARRAGYERVLAIRFVLRLSVCRVDLKVVAENGLIWEQNRGQRWDVDNPAMDMDLGVLDMTEAIHKLGSSQGFSGFSGCIH
jgi:hypothetical protein